MLQYTEETQAKGHGGFVSRNENQGNDLTLYKWQGTHPEIPVTRKVVFLYRREATLCSSRTKKLSQGAILLGV